MTVNLSLPFLQLEPPQPSPNEIHYHHALLIWGLFAFGILLHAALQVNAIAGHNKISFLTVLRVVAIPLVFRAFACSMIFLMIWQYPQMIAGAAKLIGHPMSPDESAVFAIPMNNAIAGLYGLFLDSLLGYIPLLKSQLPQVEFPTVVV
jgi:hypothetical protein